MRSVWIAVALLACNGGGDGTDTGSSSGITAPEVSTDPAESASSTEDVDAVIVTESEGPGEITYVYSWISGSETWAQPTLPGTATAKGQTWTLTVTPYAGEQSGPSGTTSVDIVNGPPSVEAAEFSPAVPTIGQDLSCLPVNPVDPDGDPVSYTYEWSRDGSSLTETSATLSASEVTVGAEITCALTIRDDTDTGNTVTVSGTANNSPPTATGSTISPASPISTDDLTCTGVGGADADGDTVTFETFQWTVNGGSPLAETSNTLPESYFVSGDAVICTAHPFDGSATGTGVPSSTVTIGNAPPEISQVLISPLAPVYGDIMVCSPTATDPDNDPLTFTYEWTVNSAVQAETSDIFTGGFVYSDNIQCTATANDGQATTSLTSSVAVVTNTPPTIDGASISPATATAAEPITCIAGSTADIDGQNVTVSFSWDVGGNSFSGATLPANSGSVGAVATCTATPNDGVTDGPAAQATLTFANIPPPTPTVSISPSNATYLDALTCTATPATDDDGESLTYTYSWTVDGSAAGTGNTLAAESAVHAQTVECTAIGNDGRDDGPAGSTSIAIANTPPSTPTVAIAPASGTVNTEFSCSAGPADDIEGETVTYTYEWTVGGSVISTNAILPPGNAVHDQTIVCEATGSDGTDTASSTSSLVLDNTPPPTPNVTIDPASGTTSTEFTCSAGPATDADGETITYTYAWTVGGTQVSSTSVLPPNSAVNGQTAVCTATGTDGTDTAQATGSVTMGNTTPPTPTVTISPTSGTTSTSFSCAAGPATDGDGETITYTYEWFVNDVSTHSGATFPTNTAVAGQELECRATGNDGTTDGPTGSDSLVIGNTLPTIDSVSLSPANPVEGQSVSCSAINPTDLDGTTPTLSYRWEVASGSISQTGSSLSSTYFNADQSIQCFVTPTDSYGAGTEVASNIVTAANTTPTGSTAVTPSSPDAQADDLICNVGISDPDTAQTLSATVEWQFYNYANTWVSWTTGVEDSGTTNRTNDAINAYDTVAGRYFRCRATVSDGAGGSSTTSYSSARLVGSPPGCPSTFDGTNQIAGPLSMYGHCFYHADFGQTCDQTCADLGLSNTSGDPINDIPEQCSGAPGTEQPIEWFYRHGNPGNSTSGSNWWYTGLGRVDSGSVRSGMCLNRVPSLAGTFPGDNNSGSTRTPLCTCGTKNVEPVSSGNTVGFSSGRYYSVGFSVEERHILSEVLGRIDSTTGCTLEYWIHTSTDADFATASWAMERYGTTTATAGIRDYSMGVNSMLLEPGTKYLVSWAGGCSPTKMEYGNTWLSPSTTREGICYGSASALLGSAWTPPNCVNASSTSTTYTNKLWISR